MATTEEGVGRKRPKTEYGSSPSSHPVTEASGDGADNSGNKKSNRERIMFTIDPDILDCSICFEELSTPIVQCPNGHIACSSCSTRVKNMCPSCKNSIYCRNLAVENILESIKIPCPYADSGCEQVISYQNVRVHRKMCEYSPCHCPAAGCTFQGPMRELYHHFTEEHRGCSISLYYSRACGVCSVGMRKDEHFRVVHGDDGVLFLVLNKTELGMGNSVMVACLGPDSMEGKYTYKVKATDLKAVSSLQLESPMSSIRRREDILPRKNFLLIPEVFDRIIVLLITIWKEGNTGRTNTATPKVSTPNTAQVSTPNTATQKVLTPNTVQVPTPSTVTQKVSTPNTAQVPTPSTATQKLPTPNTALVPTPNTVTQKVSTPTIATQKVPTPNPAPVPTTNTATQKVPTPSTVTQKVSTPNTAQVPTPSTTTQKLPTPNTAQVPTPNTATQKVSTPTIATQKVPTPNTAPVPTTNIATQKVPTPTTAQVPTPNTYPRFRACVLKLRARGEI